MPEAERRAGQGLVGLPKRLLERLRSPAIASPPEPGQTRFSTNEALVDAPPSQQNAVDLIASWTSWFPPHFHVTAGSTPLCVDDSVAWAIQALGGVADKRVLELGSLEAGHTYMLEQAGAASILGIEANKSNYLKCLIAKEIFDLKRSRFMLGDFVKYLSSTTETYDIAWVAGVLYHMEDPVELIRLVSEHADKLYMYTHYINDEALTKTWANRVLDHCTVVRGARDYEYYYRSYCGAETTAAFTGGVHSGAVWLRKQDIMDALRAYGFTNIVIKLDMPDHPNGPAIVFVAMKA